MPLTHNFRHLFGSFCLADGSLLVSCVYNLHHFRFFFCFVLFCWASILYVLGWHLRWWVWGGCSVVELRVPIFFLCLYVYAQVLYSIVYLYVSIRVRHSCRDKQVKILFALKDRRRLCELLFLIYFLFYPFGFSSSMHILSFCCVAYICVYIVRIYVNLYTSKNSII